MNKAINVIITILSVVSVIVILLLVFFADAFFAIDVSDNVVNITTESVNISFDTDPLILDGTSLDLMEGVVAKDESGNDVTDLVTASVVNEGNDKYIMYSVNSSDYNLETYKRGLQLKNYKGPSIALKKTTYTCDINEIDSYIISLIEAKSIKAYDGYGNDISLSVYVDPSVQIKEAGTQNVTLVVKNSLADTVKRDISIKITGTLDQSKVTISTETTSIKKNSSFSPSEYIVTAVDGDGNDITDKIIFENNVDVTTSGRYKVYYYVAGEDTDSPAATLTVVVTD
ncbi:MAG: hypothetical protein U0M12_02575 [Acutalibacteraceae bacterium]|nr:hypothetical protein [Acutalibacteraceae bacterium]